MSWRTGLSIGSTRLILSAAILGVDVTEVYSPERVARVAKRFALTTGSFMDLTIGWDFNRDDHKRQAWSKIKEEAPLLLIGCPPCTYSSAFQELNKAVHGDKLWLAGEVRHRDGQGHQAYGVLLCLVLVPGATRIAFSTRTPLDGEVLESPDCCRTFRTASSVHCPRAHVPVPHDVTHRSPWRRDGTCQETNRVHEQQ